ncbi:nucleoporin autopeptidase-domain-containing protein, partial [Piptocephalis cylindrospora]
SDDSYWMYPPYEQLRKMSKDALSRIEDFRVGRRGHGQVRFLRPVDLTGISILAAIPGNLVLFERKGCTVYPDEATKPARGEGLNIPAQITLERIWVVDRAMRRPIVDEADPRFQAHVTKLRSVTDTEFIEYLGDKGTWVFRVQH